MCVQISGYIALDPFVIYSLYILGSLRPFHAHSDPFHIYLDPFHVYKLVSILTSSVTVTSEHLISKCLAGNGTTNYCYIFSLFSCYKQLQRYESYVRV